MIWLIGLILTALVMLAAFPVFILATFVHSELNSNILAYLLYTITTLMLLGTPGLYFVLVFNKLLTQG